MSISHIESSFWLDKSVTSAIFLWAFLGLQMVLDGEISAVSPGAGTELPRVWAWSVATWRWDALGRAGPGDVWWWWRWMGELRLGPEFWRISKADHGKIE